MWWNYIKTAFRNLIRHRSYTLVNILGLSFGLAIFVALALYIQFELSFDNFHENADRLYRIEQIMNAGGRIERMTGTPTPLWKALKDELPEIEASMRLVVSSIKLTDTENKAFNVTAYYVEEDFLQAFTFPLIKGNIEEVLIDPQSIVLTKKTAGKLFGEEDHFGKMYDIDGTPFKITGILEDIPKNSHMDFDLLIPVNTIGEEPFTYWHDNWVRLYVMLKPGYHIGEFRSKIKYLLKKFIDEETLNELDARPIRDIHLYADVPDDFAVIGSIQHVYILFAIAVFLLLMAGVNFTNLSIAYSSVRTHEVAIRKVSGGTRSLLLTQFLGESVLMVIISLFLGFVIFETILPWFNHIVNQELDFKYLHNLPLFFSIILIGIILGVLSGIYPAILISGFKPIAILRKQIPIGNRNPYLRKILISIQFFISAVLIVGAIGVVRQTYYLKNKDLGFNPEFVIRVPLDDSSMLHINTFREQLLRDPRIVNASVHDYPVCNSENWTGIVWEGVPEGEFIRINVNYTDHHYLNTYQIKLTEGEGFTGPQKDTLTGGNKVILNRVALNSMGLKDPIGKKIYYYRDYKRYKETEATIVGIVEDYHFLSAHNPITPIMLRLYNGDMVGWSISVRLNGADINNTLDNIRKLYEEFYPEQVFDYEFVDEFHARMYLKEDKLSRIVFYLSLLAVIIACLGVYGLVAFITSRRTREVGIRKVMGAGFVTITNLFAREFLLLIVISNFIAWPVAYYLIKNWLQSFPYRIDFSPLPYFVALLLTLIFALLSMLYQIFRVSRINPAESLRYE
jgi:putative ABC transport system permease protein